MYPCVMEQKIDLSIKEPLRTVPIATLMYSRRFKMRVAYGKGEGLVTTKLNGPQKIKQVIARKLPPTADQEWILETRVAVKIILKNINFYAAGPNRLLHF